MVDLKYTKYSIRKEDGEKMLQRPNINLPFFAYGSFKPGQIAYSRIEKHIKSKSPADCKHKLFLRDGSPFISKDSIVHGSTSGVLIEFKRNCKWDAYGIICEVASDKLYYWEVINVEGRHANALIGRKPSKSNPRRIGKDFDGSNDPYFKEAIEVIEDGIEEYGKDLKHCQSEDEMMKIYFKLLRNYILLWSSVERYIGLRYGKGNYELSNKELFATEKIFQESLRDNIGDETRDIFRTDNLEKITLDANCPEDSIDYYYTVRCNIVHRGKTPHGSDEIVFKSLNELLNIFKDVLNDTFNES